MCKRMVNILTKNDSLKQKILLRVSEEPNTIDKYINLLEYIKDNAMKKQLSDCENDLRIANIIHQNIEMHYIKMEKE